MTRTPNWKRTRTLAGALTVAVLTLVAAAKTPKEGQQDQQTQEPLITNLYPSRTVEFPAPAPVVVSPGTGCDANANIYIQYSQALEDIYRAVQERRPTNFPLRKFSFGSGQVVTFPVGPFQGYNWFNTASFYVTPNGDVYDLAMACGDAAGPEHCNWLVAKYKDDGTVGSLIALRPRLPEDLRLNAVLFAVFPDGNLLVAGHAQARDGSMKPFTGIFDRSGGFQSELTLPGDVGPSPPPESVVNPSAESPAAGSSASAKPSKTREAIVGLERAVSGSRLVGAPDGTIYLVRGGSPSRLYVLSSYGSVLREQTITPPAGGLSPFNMSVNARGQLAIFYTRSPHAQNTGPSSVLALVDPQTGKIVSTYALPPQAGAPACVTGQGMVLFVQQSKSGHFEV